MPEPRRPRADAIRNRRLILRATEELLSHHRPDQVSMEQIAAAAGVGKGTVFHRFGSRNGLMIELMRERATTLGEAIATGPPPLGPGAPARARLEAFFDAVFDVIARNKGLLAALGHTITHPPEPAEPKATADAVASVRAAHPVYETWHAHTANLITEARPDLDAEMLADVLLSTLYSDVIVLTLRQGETDRVAAAVRALITALLDQNPDGR